MLFFSSGDFIHTSKNTKVAFVCEDYHAAQNVYGKHHKPVFLSELIFSNNQKFMQKLAKLVAEGTSAMLASWLD